MSRPSERQRERAEMAVGIALLVVIAATLLWLLAFRSPSDAYFPGLPPTTTTCCTGACS